MASEIDRLIDGVARELASRERDGAPARLLVATRRFDAQRAEVWDALTNPARIPRWFLPISGDVRPGGRYQFVGNAGGEILACDAPARFEITWEMHGQASWVTVLLSDAPDAGTSLRLEHLAHVPDEFWTQYGPGAVGVGWDQAMLGLDRHLATGAPVDPAEMMAWAGSEEGRAFVQGSSDAWGAASIAAGTDPESARAAAARTTGFYTGT